METARVISEADIVRHRGAGYHLVNGELKNQEWVAASWNTTADGALYFTVLDLAKWDAALYGTALLSDSSKRLMWTPVRLNDGALASCGLGWFLSDEPGRRAVEHDGRWQGFTGHIARYVDDSVTVIVLANAAHALPVRMAHVIAGLYRPALGPPRRTPARLPADQLVDYVGRYRLPAGDTIEIRRSEEGGLSGERRPAALRPGPQDVPDRTGAPPQVPPAGRYERGGLTSRCPCCVTEESEAGDTRTSSIGADRWRRSGGRNG
jgi:hypothetical protein